MKTKLLIFSLLITLINLTACILAGEDILIPAKFGDTCGIIDGNGRWVINPQFRTCSKFSNGLAVASIADGYEPKYGYIDQTGKWVIKPQFTVAEEFADNGLAAACKDYNILGFGYIDKTGNFVIEPQFFYAQPFHMDLAVAYKSENQLGYIDQTGNWVIEPQFVGASDFQDNGLATIAISDNEEQLIIGFIDKSGH